MRACERKIVSKAENHEVCPRVSARALAMAFTTWDSKSDQDMERKSNDSEVERSPTSAEADKSISSLTNRSSVRIVDSDTSSISNLPFSAVTELKSFSLSFATTERRSGNTRRPQTSRKPKMVLWLVMLLPIRMLHGNF